eukprot:INCI1009.1.p2 GENE.INCI1009.1~~INCI1009.1.p2  ORF type:complete len:279 (+),score=47.91 INCI1009.1:1-837(+)
MASPRARPSYFFSFTRSLTLSHSPFFLSPFCPPPTNSTSFTMGAAASVSEMQNGIAESKTDLRNFVANFAPLAQPGKEAMAARKQSWMAVDPNGNGLVSLAEFDGWIKKTLLLNAGENTEEAERLWKLYRPSYIRAFNDAKDQKAEREIKTIGDATTDDYVTRGEFRLAVAYLCLYAAMFDAFNAIDGGSEGTTATDDRRMSLEEWTKAYPTIASSGYGFVALAKVADESTEDSPESVFKEMDADGKGMVLLNEWCKWLEAAEIAAGTLAGKMLASGD